MKYRDLGATGLSVSEVGFGAWGIGGVGNGAVSYGPTDDEESKAALRRAFDLGVTFYDTADLYGYGHSESLIGGVLKDVRKQIVIASKVGLLGPYGPQDFSPEHIRTALEGSLRRLQTDYVDLYQLHNPPIELLPQDERVLGTLGDLQREGKVRVIGISVRSPEDGLAVAREFGFRSIQVNFNMVDQRALENGLFDLCSREGVGVICRTPLCFGFLTGKYSGVSRFDVSDHRSAWSSEQLKRWAEASQMFAAATAGRSHQTHAQIALRFCLSNGAVSTVIPGMLTREQVDENVIASELGPLSEIERVEMEQIYRENTFFLGKR